MTVMRNPSGMGYVDENNNAVDANGNLTMSANRQGTFSDIGAQNGQVNVWNSSRNDGSVPWDVAQSLGIGPGAMYGGGNGTGSGSSQRLYGNTGSDAFLNSALGRLQGTVDGTTLPFDQNTRTNMLSKASDMNAAAEASNAGDVRERVAANGGSASDPATQAALAQLKSGRQQGNAQAAQAIDTHANVANFGAQHAAANDLGGMRLQQAQVDPYYNGAPHSATTTAWGAAGSAGGGAPGIPGIPAGGSAAAGPYTGAGMTDFAAMAKAGGDWRTEWRNQNAAALTGGKTSTGSYGWQPVNGAGFNTGAGSSSSPRLR